MKTLLLLLFLFTGIAQAQEYYYENNIEYVKLKASDYESVRNKAIKYYMLYKTSDSINFKYEQITEALMKIHQRDSLIALRKDSIQILLQNEVLEYDKKLNECLGINTGTQSSFFQYEGTSFGITAGYLFDTTTLHTTFMNSLQYGLKLESGLRIDKWTFRPSLVIPFKTAMSISLFVGYKVW